MSMKWIEGSQKIINSQTCEKCGKQIPAGEIAFIIKVEGESKPHYYCSPCYKNIHGWNKHYRTYGNGNHADIEKPDEDFI